MPSRAGCGCIGRPQICNRGPQVRGTRGSEEVTPHDAPVIGDDDERHRVDRITLVERSLRAVLHFGHGHMRTVEHVRLADHVATPTALRAREHDDKPFGIGTGEVAAVQLRWRFPRSVKHGTIAWRRRSALRDDHEQQGDDSKRCCDANAKGHGGTVRVPRQPNRNRSEAARPPGPRRRGNRV